MTLRSFICPTVFAFTVLAGCASNPYDPETLAETCTFPGSTTRAPEWVCVEPGGLFAVASQAPNGGDRDFRRTLAETRAKARLVRMIQERTRTQSQENTEADGQQAQGFQRQTISSRADVISAGIRTYATVWAPDDTVYVKVGYDETLARDVTRLPGLRIPNKPVDAETRTRHEEVIREMEARTPGT